MPSFKPKAKKKIAINSQQILTVDNQHNEKMKLFDDIEKNQIPQLNARKKELENFLKSTQNIEEKLNEASVIIIIRDKYIDNEKKELSIRGLCALKQLEEKRYMLLLLGSGSRCKMVLRSVERIEKGRGMLVIEYLKLISGVLIIVNSIEDSIGYYKKAGCWGS